MAVFNGNDFVLKYGTASDGTGQEIFAHAQSASVSFSNSLIDTTTKDSKSWSDMISGQKSFTISTDGLVDYATVANQNNFVHFSDIALAGTQIYFTIGMGTNAGEQFEGSGFIDSFEASGGVDDVTTYSVSITGTGALEKTS